MTAAGRRIRNATQVGVVLLIAFLLWRFFPWAVGFIEAAAMDIRRFWWVILLIALGIWSVWVLNKRNPL